MEFCEKILKALFSRTDFCVAFPSIFGGQIIRKFECSTFESQIELFGRPLFDSNSNIRTHLPMIKWSSPERVLKIMFYKYAPIYYTLIFCSPFEFVPVLNSICNTFNHTGPCRDS